MYITQVAACELIALGQLKNILSCLNKQIPLITMSLIDIIFRKSACRVKLKGRSQIEYIEGNKHLLIEFEFLAGDAGIAIYSNSLQTWEPPFNEESITKVDKEQIKRNILINLQKRKIPAEWE